MATSNRDVMVERSTTLDFISFFCSGFNNSVLYIKELVQNTKCDILCLQETWLLDGNMNKLSEINSDYVFTGISGVDSSADVLQGRPYGGTGILWKKTLAGSISVIKSGHNRLSAIKLVFPSNSTLLLVNVYMPCDNQQVHVAHDELIDTIALSNLYVNRIMMPLLSVVTLIHLFNVTIRILCLCAILWKEMN